MATGAAVAAPGRQVINLQADGSAMYTLQVRVVQRWQPQVLYMMVCAVVCWCWFVTCEVPKTATWTLLIPGATHMPHNGRSSTCRQTAAQCTRCRCVQCKDKCDAIVQVLYMLIWAVASWCSSVTPLFTVQDSHLGNCSYLAVHTCRMQLGNQPAGRWQRNVHAEGAAHMQWRSTALHILYHIQHPGQRPCMEVHDLFGAVDGVAAAHGTARCCSISYM
jgi:hypothetical protein